MNKANIYLVNILIQSQSNNNCALTILNEIASITNKLKKKEEKKNSKLINSLARTQ